MFKYCINTMNAFLYAAPNDNALVVDEALHGMSAVILEKYPNGWLKVCMEYGYEGFLKETTSEAMQPEQGEPPYAPQMVYAIAADILSKPNVKAARIITLTMGCKVWLMEDAGHGWVRVALPGGRVGFMRGSFLKAIPRRIDLERLTAPETDALRERILATAFYYRGTQYRWGGKSPLGIDCSGLSFMAYWLNGITIGRDAKIIPGFPVKEISPQAAQKADLLFFPGHVGISMGDGQMLHASEAENGVNMVSVDKEVLKRGMPVAGSVFASTA